MIPGGGVGLAMLLVVVIALLLIMVYQAIKGGDDE